MEHGLLKLNTYYFCIIISVTKTEAEAKKMWVYEGCFDIIRRIRIQVNFMDSYLSFGKHPVLGLYRFYSEPLTNYEWCSNMNAYNKVACKQ